MRETAHLGDVLGRRILVPVAEHQFNGILRPVGVHKLGDAPWPATREELIDYATRSGAPLEVIENLEDLEEDGEVYDSIEDIWPDYPTKDDFFFDEEEY